MALSRIQTAAILTAGFFILSKAKDSGGVLGAIRAGIEKLRDGTIDALPDGSAGRESINALFGPDRTALAASEAPNQGTPAQSIVHGTVPDFAFNASSAYQPFGFNYSNNQEVFS